MKYCAHCGAELLDEAAICPKCGCSAGGSTSQAQTPQNSWNGMAIAGFVLSFFFAVVGLILSILAYKQTKQTGEKGKELALAGIIISSVSLAASLVGVVVEIIYFVIYGAMIFSILGEATTALAFIL